MRRQRLVIVAMTIIGMISVFLPWNEGHEDVTSESTTGDGWMVAGLFIICFILSIAGNRNRSIRGSQYVLLLVTSLIIILFSLIKMYEIVESHRAGSSFLNVFGITSVGFGLYTILVLGFAMPIVAISIKKSKAKRRGRHHHERPYKEHSD